MATLKNIFWREELPKDELGRTFANVHVLRGYTNESLATLGRMAEELREVVPTATHEEIKGGKVHKSSYVQGFSIVTWSGHLSQGEYPGWCQYDGTSMEYFW